MRKAVFLLLFLFQAFTVLSLEDIPPKQYLTVKDKSFFGKKLRPKIFVAGNCELKIKWRSQGFDLQLIYTEYFPPELVKYLNNNNSAKVFSAFYITFLDDNDYELAKDMCYFNDFKIESSGGKQRAVFRDHLKCDQDIYNRISAVVIDFNP